MQKFLKYDYTKLLQKRSNFVKSSPYKADLCYAKELQKEMTFLSITAPKITNFLEHAVEIISNKLNPTLTYRNAPDDITRLVFYLPVRNGGLAIKQPDDDSRINSDFQNGPAPLNDSLSDLIILEQH